MNGRLIISKENETKINVSGLANGAYLATITTKDSKAVRKIIIGK
jgi:aminopeptidase YwaD